MPSRATWREAQSRRLSLIAHRLRRFFRKLLQNGMRFGPDDDAQEELDWETYRLYALIDEDFIYGGDDLPGACAGRSRIRDVIGSFGRRG